MSEFITYTLETARTLSNFIYQINDTQIDAKLLITIPENKSVVEVAA